MSAERLHRATLVAAFAALGCGGSATPTDAGADAPSEPCAVVDGRGGDGRFASIDDAIASGAGRICLTEGDFAAPTRPVDRGITLEGAGDATRVDGVFGCNAVQTPANLETLARTETAAVVVVTTGGSATLRRLVLRGCDEGVVALDGAVTLEDVSIESVDLGVIAVGARAALVVRDTRVAPRPLAIGTRSTFPGGIGAVEGATLVVASTEIQGQHANLGIVAFDAPSVTVASSSIDGGVDGFFIRAAEGAAISITDVTVEHLREVTIGDTTAVAANVVAGGAARIERLAARDIEGYGLVATMGATLTVLDTEASAVRDLALVARAGASLTVQGARLSDVGVGVAADHAQVTMTGDVGIRSRRSGLAAFADGTIQVTSASTVSIEGGELGIWTDVGGRVAFRAGAIHDVAWGVLSNGSVEAYDVTITDTDIGLASYGSITATDLLVASARSVGSFATGTGVVALERATFDSSGPIWLGAAAHTLTDVVIRNAVGAGLLLDEPGSVVLVRGEIRDGAGRGIDVRDGGDLAIDGTVFRGNVGAAIALYDASAEVRGATFGGTLPDAAGRADEIRFVARSGTERTTVVESSTFLLDVPRTCGPDACALVIGEGADAVGIVRPNGLVATPGAGEVHTVVDQGGAMITLEGDVGWSTLLGGRASDLGLDTGTAGARPMLAAPPGPPPLPATF